MQLETGEVVTLVRVEGGGASLRVRTTDAHPTEGTVPTTFLRKKDTINGVDMAGTYNVHVHVHACIVNYTLINVYGYKV